MQSSVSNTKGKTCSSWTTAGLTAQGKILPPHPFQRATPFDRMPIVLNF
jgi:hypothetical protein